MAPTGAMRRTSMTAVLLLALGTGCNGTASPGEICTARAGAFVNLTGANLTGAGACECVQKSSCDTCTAVPNCSWTVLGRALLVP